MPALTPELIPGDGAVATAPIEVLDGAPGEVASDLGFRIQVDAFSGPMDLLLYLVRKAEVPIVEVELAPIADQFVTVVRQWQAAGELHLEEAGDFILMAATLLEIKARTIAPPPETDEEVDDEDDDLVDPRADLVAKLLAYRRFKEATQALQQLENARVLRSSRQVREEIPEDPEEAAGIDLGELHALDLFRCWDLLMKRIGGTGPRTVLRDDIPIEASIRQLSEQAEREVRLKLHPILHRIPTMQGRISFVMATLECTRQKIIETIQLEQYGDVDLRFRPIEERTAPPPALPADEPAKKRRRRPPLVTYQAPPTVIDAERDDEALAAEAEERHETDEERFVRELNEACDLDGVLGRVQDVEAGFLEHWYALHPELRPKPPEPPEPPPEPVKAEEPSAVEPPALPPAEPTAETGAGASPDADPAAKPKRKWPPDSWKGRKPWDKTPVEPSPTESAAAGETPAVIAEAPAGIAETPGGNAEPVATERATAEGPIPPAEGSATELSTQDPSVPSDNGSAVTDQPVIAEEPAAAGGSVTRLGDPASEAPIELASSPCAMPELPAATPESPIAPLAAVLTQVLEPLASGEVVQVIADLPPSAEVAPGVPAELSATPSAELAQEPSADQPGIQRNADGSAHPAALVDDEATTEPVPHQASIAVEPQAESSGELPVSSPTTDATAPIVPVDPEPISASAVIDELATEPIARATVAAACQANDQRATDELAAQPAAEPEITIEAVIPLSAPIPVGPAPQEPEEIASSSPSATTVMEAIVRGGEAHIPTRLDDEPVEESVVGSSTRATLAIAVVNDPAVVELREALAATAEAATADDPDSVRSVPAIQRPELLTSDDALSSDLRRGIDASTAATVADTTTIAAAVDTTTGLSDEPPVEDGSPGVESTGGTGEDPEVVSPTVLVPTPVVVDDGHGELDDLPEPQPIAAVADQVARANPVLAAYAQLPGPPALDDQELAILAAARQRAPTPAPTPVAHADRSGLPWRTLLLATAVLAGVVVALAFILGDRGTTPNPELEPIPSLELSSESVAEPAAAHRPTQPSNGQINPPASRQARETTGKSIGESGPPTLLARVSASTSTPIILPSLDPWFGRLVSDPLGCVLDQPAHLAVPADAWLPASRIRPLSDLASVDLGTLPLTWWAVDRPWTLAEPVSKPGPATRFTLVPDICFLPPVIAIDLPDFARRDWSTIRPTWWTQDAAWSLGWRSDQPWRFVESLPLPQLPGAPPPSVMELLQPIDWCRVW